MTTCTDISSRVSYALTRDGREVDIGQIADDAHHAQQMCGDDREMRAALAFLVELKQRGNGMTWDECAAKAFTLLSQVPGLDRVATVKAALHTATTANTEEMSRAAARHFRRCVKTTAERVGELQVEAQPDAAEAQAELIMLATYDVDEWHDDLLRTMMPKWAGSFVSGAAMELRLTSAALDEKLTSAEAIANRLNIQVPAGISIGRMPQWLIDAAKVELTATFTEPYWTQIVQTTRDDIQDTVEEGIRNGLSIRKVAKEIERKQGAQYDRVRAMRVARTECLVADVPVNGADITAAYKREYSGDLFELVTDLGSKVTGTPNHPMLTLRGWIALSELQESDYLIGYELSVEGSRASGDEHINAPPSTIGKIFDSLAAVIVPGGERTRQPDFHGDGMDGYVNVLRPDSVLHYGFKPTITESLIGDTLELSDLRQVLRSALCCPFSTAVPQGVSSSLCAVSNFTASTRHDSVDMSLANGILASDVTHRHVRSVISQHLDVIEMFSVSAIASREHALPRLRQRSHFTRSLDYSCSGVGSNVQLLCDRPIRDPASVHHQDSLFDIFRKPLIVSAGIRRVLPNGNTRSNECSSNSVCADTERETNGSQRLPRQIQLHRVSSLRCIKSARCHVYNLSTEDGYFIADGLCTGNTANALNGGHVAGIKRLAEETGEPLGKEWLSVLGNTTRADHAAIDGVTVGADDTFVLAGVSVPWPGHHKLPPEQRINCQCSILSSVVMDALEEDAAQGTVSPDDKAPVFANMPAHEIANSHPGLEQKRKAVLKVQKDIEQAIDETWDEEEVILKKFAKDDFRVMQLMEQAEAKPQGPERTAFMRDHKEELDRLNASREELGDAMERLGERRKQLKASQRKRIVDVLKISKEHRGKWQQEKHRGSRIVDPTDHDHVDSLGKYTAGWNAKMRDAQFFVRDITNTSGVDDNVLKVRVHRQQDGSRPFARSKNVAFDDREVRHGVFVAETKPTAVFAHEIGHHLENVIPGVQQRANEFLDYRIAKAGHPNQKMKAVFPRSGYGEEEVGNQDGFSRIWDRNFDNDFPSASDSKLINPAFYNGKRYSSGDTEIISMGLEKMYENAVEFAERDPEYFKFMLGVLDGTIR